MQEKYCLSSFESLPNEINQKIFGAYFDKKSKNSIALVSHFFYQQSQYQRLINSLKCYFAFANQLGAANILRNHPALMLQELSFKDNSGRLFTGVTFWKYVLWTLDVRYMASMMLDCLPVNDKGKLSNEGRIIAIELLRQFNDLETEGICYELDSISYKGESYYNFSIISALETYVAKYPLPSISTDNSTVCKDKATDWCKGVGQAELLVPAHVAQHYCDSEKPLGSMPDFQAETFNRTLTFHNYVTCKPEQWWPQDESNGLKLGDDFAIGVIGLGIISIGCGWKISAGASVDLAAMRSLRDRRIADLALLKQRLNNLVQESELQTDFVYSGIM